MIPLTDPDWIAKGRDIFKAEFGLPHGLATAAAGALLAREKLRGRVRPPYVVVWEHMDSDEPPIVDPDGNYGDGLTIRLGPG